MKTQAQSTIEFTFAMVMVALLIFGLIKSFRWVGLNYAQGSYEQQQGNIFVHPQNCDPASSCFSNVTEEGSRTQRLTAYTRNF